jgi:hypothetical protein
MDSAKALLPALWTGLECGCEFLAGAAAPDEATLGGAVLAEDVLHDALATAGKAAAVVEEDVVGLPTSAGFSTGAMGVRDEIPPSCMIFPPASINLP